MGVPQLLLFGGQGGIELRGDHIFNTDEPGVGCGRVVDQALPHRWGDVCAVMVGFHAAGRGGGVDVEGIQMGAD